MLGFVLLYWIGKYFYELAEVYNKSQWRYAILGIVVYYGGIGLFGIIIGIVLEVFIPGFIEDSVSFYADVIIIPKHAGFTFWFREHINIVPGMQYLSVEERHFM